MIHMVRMEGKNKQQWENPEPAGYKGMMVGKTYWADTLKGV